jgi:zinc/manganese transport system permease protein
LAFTFVGAAFFAYIRSSNQKVPQEAIIGITYVVCAAAMILLFSKSAEGSEHLNHLLVGSILFVTPKKIAYTALLYVAIGFFHFKYKKQFFRISESHLNMTALNSSDRFWDFLFYVTFGFVVTSSVKIAGVLLVFSFLIIPTIAALLFKESIRGRLIFGWSFGIIGSLAGMFISILLDLPTGATIVVTFGVMLALLGLIKLVKRHSS